MPEPAGPPKPVKRPAVKVWFWDGQREYSGEAVDLSPQRLTAFLRMSQFGDATVVPARAIMEGLSRHLTGRTVDLKVSSGPIEADVKARIAGVNPDFENPRRLLLEAEFQSPPERTQSVLARLARTLPP